MQRPVFLFCVGARWPAGWCMALMLLTAPLQARELAGGASLDFDLPAQPLALALDAFSTLTGYSVLVPGSLTAGRQAKGVTGHMPADLALSRMLTGTGLAARYIGERSVTLVPLLPESPDNDPFSAMAPTTSAQGEGGAGPMAYAGVLQRSVTRRLCHRQPRHFGRYRVGVQLWLDAAGRVGRVQVLQSSGLTAQDDALAADLRGLVMDAPPPDGLPQPVTLLLTPRLDPAQDCREMAGQPRPAGMPK